jgi:hypothetical protein
MAKTEAIKQHKAKRTWKDLAIDWSRFFTLVSMMLKDTLNLDFKGNRKASIIKAVTALVGFAALTAVSYFFFFFSARLNIFSLLSFVPETVPSIIVMAAYFIGFIPALLALIKDLYWSRDNKIMIALPCNANTVFVARMTVFFISQCIRTLIIEIPFLFGFMLFTKFPWYIFFWSLLGWALLVLLEVLILSILSIPGYFVGVFLKRHNILNIVMTSLFFVALVGLVAWCIMLLPDSVNLFSSWGPYFAKIQKVLIYYQTHLSVSYDLTIMTIGIQNGFGSVLFTTRSLITLASVVGLIIVAFFLMIILVNPLYFKLASSSNDFLSNSERRAKRLKVHGPVVSQIKKEALLFFKDPNIFSGLFGAFVFMPIYISLLDKVFGAMTTNIRGNMMVYAINVMLILLVSLSSNTIVSRIYSEEGDAFALTRSYPGNPKFMLSAKIFWPGLMGVVSIAVSVYLFASLKKITFLSGFLIAIGIICLYLGHLLFAAGLDFTSKHDHFESSDFTSESEKRVMIIGIVVALLMGVLFYLFMTDFFVWGQLTREQTASMKFMLFGIFGLAINVLLFFKKIRYVYMEGRVL